MNRLRAIAKYLLGNWQLKVLALLLGAITFYAVRGAIGYEVEYDVPVEIVVEPGIAVLDQDPLSVRVRFRGSRQDLLHIEQKNIKVVVQPHAEAPDGADKSVNISSRDVKGAGAATVVKIDPSAVRLTFDRETTSTVAVAEPKTVGTPLVGTAQIEYHPTTVRIRGPKLRVSELASNEGRLSTEPVEVDGRVESFTRSVRILPPAGMRISQIDPPEITVTVSIVTETIAREWQDIPVHVIVEEGRPHTVYIDPPKVDVSLTARAEVLDKISDDMIRIMVDCVELESPATYELPVIVHLPLDIDAKTTVEPKTVSVTLEGESGI